MFEVHMHSIADGWSNQWNTVDKNNQPTKVVYATKELAQADIDEEIKDCEDAVREGFMDDAPTQDDFTIVEI